jgi:hypothetical protein
MPTVSGTILDINGNGVLRVLRIYRRDTGVLLGSTSSNAITGAYSFSDAFSGEVNVVMLDDAAGTIENDQILRTTPV